MSVESSSIEGKTMSSLVDEFCKEWCSRKSEMKEMKEETISLIAKVQTLFVTGSIKVGDMVGPNLHSEFETLMNELKETQNQVKYMREHFLEVKGKKKTTVDYGVFSSKVAKDFASENGIDGNDIEGSGKNNKITKKDIQKFIGSVPKKQTKKVKKHCNGAKETGSPCKNSGSLLIKGKWYCKKHQKQAVSEEFEEEEFEEYDDSKDTPLDDNDDELTRFRKESLKSIDNMSEEDDMLNTLIS